MKRTKLADRMLPDYTRGEEIMNMVTHIVGGAMGIAVLTLCVIRAAIHANVWGIVTSAIYGTTMITMFTISSVYHGLKPNLGKKVRSLPVLRKNPGRLLHPRNLPSVKPHC